MPDNLNGWIIGAGNIALEYAHILSDLGVSYQVIGRGGKSAAAFVEFTGHDVFIGGLDKYISEEPQIPDFAIIAVSVDQLSDVSARLLDYGVKKLLIEKPAALNREELEAIVKKVKGQQAYVAYNRRYLASVQSALDQIEEDGGVRSFHFEFTEWPSRILSYEQPPRALENWFYLNSTHVVDLAFFIGGFPKEISCFNSGSLDWHSPAVFGGAGITTDKVPFSYKADWGSAGRWSVEIMTSKRRFLFAPLEQLKEQRLNDVNVYNVEIDDSMDTKYKPGFFKQTKAFLGLGGEESLLTLQGQLEHWFIYEKMMGRK